MPLVGVVDPSHSALRKQRAGKLPPWLGLEEALELAAEKGPKWSSWQYELMAAAIREHEERGDRISSSLLVTSCPRGAVLERKVDWVGDLKEMYASTRGTLLHKVLQDYNRPNSIPEVRFYTTVDEEEISCSPDLLAPGIIWDWKMTENPPDYYPWPSHKHQLLLNAFIVRHAERWEAADGSPVKLPFDPREEPPTQCVVVYIGSKMPKPMLVERKETWYTPQNVEKYGNRPYVWTDKEALAWLRPRLHVMRAALRDFPDWPEGAEEVWGGKPGWQCPGYPLCKLPNCLARRDPDLYTWPKEGGPGVFDDDE